MLIQFSQLSIPLAAFTLVCAVNLEVIEHTLESLVVKIFEVSTTARRTWLVVSLDPIQAALAEAVATARGLVGLSQHMETDGALCFEKLGRW